MAEKNHKYLKMIKFPTRFFEEGKYYEPLEAAGLTVENLRKNVYMHDEQLKNGFYGDALVIKMVRVK